MLQHWGRSIQKGSKLYCSGRSVHKPQERVQIKPLISQTYCCSLTGQPLQDRRAQAKVVMFYKIVNNLVGIPAATVNQPIVIRGYNHRSLIPFARTVIYQHSFYPDAIRLWNSIRPSTLYYATLLCPSASRCSKYDFVKYALILACYVNECINCRQLFVFV